MLNDIVLRKSIFSKQKLLLVAFSKSSIFRNASQKFVRRYKKCYKSKVLLCFSMWTGGSWLSMNCIYPPAPSISPCAFCIFYFLLKVNLLQNISLNMDTVNVFTQNFPLANFIFVDLYLIFHHQNMLHQGSILFKCFLA